MMEMHRKQQLMAKKKTARAALSFESQPPAKSRKLQNPFTPTRTAADIIGATQADEDFERDSLASQSSRTTARIRLQENMSKLPHCTKTNGPLMKLASASAKLQELLWRNL